jgi:hypothetical protein
MESSRQIGHSPGRVVRTGFGGGSLPEEEQAQNHVESSSESWLKDYDIFDRLPRENSSPTAPTGNIVLSLSLDKLNRCIKWAGLQCDIVRTHAQTVLRVEWRGPEIWKRFKEWERE